MHIMVKCSEIKLYLKKKCMANVWPKLYTKNSMLCLRGNTPTSGLCVHSSIRVSVVMSDICAKKWLSASLESELTLEGISGIAPVVLL